MEQFLHKQLVEVENRCNEQAKDFEMRLKDRTHQLNMARRSTLSQEQQNRQLQAEVKQLRSELRGLVSKAERAAKAAMREDMNALKQKLKQLNKQLADSNKTHKKQRNQIESLAQQEQDLQEEKRSMQKALSTLSTNSSDQIVAFQARISQLEEQLKQATANEQRAKESVSSLTDKNAMLTYELQDLSKLSRDLKFSFEQTRIELREQTKANNKKDHEIKDLEAHCAHLKASKDKLQKDYEANNDGVERAKEDREQIQKTLQQTQDAEKELRLSIVDFKANAELRDKAHQREISVLTAKGAKEQESLKKQNTKLTTQRNRYKRKAESLSGTVKTLLREKAASTSTVASLYEQKLAAEKKEKKAVLQALDTYKKAFEQQLMNKKSSGKKLVFLANTQADKELLTLRRLANGLSETINDKDEVIVHMRRANKMLGARIQELERQLKIYEEMADKGDNASKTNFSSPRTATSMSDRATTGLSDRVSTGLSDRAIAAPATTLSERWGSATTNMNTREDYDLKSPHTPATS